MRIGYLDCFSGIAGDMLLGAMVGCGLPLDELRGDLAGLALDGYRLEHRRVQRGALAAHKVEVVVEGDDHHGRGLGELRQILAASELPAGVAEAAGRVFEALCAAEAEVHGVPVGEVHLHDVGAVDAIVDIVGACCGLHRLGIDRLRCSPLNVGGGQVDSAHGVLPVPAPATVRLLEDAPVYSRGPQAELVTPTGAALVSTLGTGWGGWPEMTLEAVGYGAGDQEFEELPNVLRLAVGRAAPAKDGGHDAEISVVETNIDDMNPQIFSSLIPRLLDDGALDAYTTSVQMKKGRPGFQLTVLVRRPDVDRLVELLFRETSTLGVRTWPVERRELGRRQVPVETPWGSVQMKVATLGDEVVNAAPEYDNCAALAERAGVPVKRVLQAATAAWGERSRDESEEQPEPKGDS